MHPHPYMAHPITLTYLLLRKLLYEVHRVDPEFVNRIAPSITTMDGRPSPTMRRPMSE